ncbi:MAG: hypothetical protein EOP84_03765 [Verrucomicrobiaceae bacterium]|nr:MAG: hypothetical protein EOP84_03765 [Verrucomicrobiaceae bacterium]
MYGLSPAKFCKRLRNDEERYEEVEVQWLLAAWPSYMESIDKQVRFGQPKVYELTKQGRQLNCLLMADWYDYKIWTTEDELAECLAMELQAEIDREIVATLRGNNPTSPINYKMVGPAWNTEYKPTPSGLLLKANFQVP